MKQSVYFFRWGTTTDISLISRSTGSALLAAGVTSFEIEFPFAPFEAGRDAILSSSRLFFVAGPDEGVLRLQMWRDIWLKSSIYGGEARISLDLLECLTESRKVVGEMVVLRAQYLNEKGTFPAYTYKPLLE